MSARLVEIIIPDAQVPRAKSIIGKHCSRFWQEAVPGDLEKIFLRGREAVHRVADREARPRFRRCCRFYRHSLN